MVVLEAFSAEVPTAIVCVNPARLARNREALPNQRLVRRDQSHRKMELKMATLLSKLPCQRFLTDQLVSATTPALVRRPRSGSGIGRQSAQPVAPNEEIGRNSSNRPIVRPLRLPYVGSQFVANDAAQSQLHSVGKLVFALESVRPFVTFPTK